VSRRRVRRGRQSAGSGLCDLDLGWDAPPPFRVANHQFVWRPRSPAARGSSSRSQSPDRAAPSPSSRVRWRDSRFTTARRPVGTRICPPTRTCSCAPPASMSRTTLGLVTVGWELTAGWRGQRRSARFQHGPQSCPGDVRVRARHTSGLEATPGSCTSCLGRRCGSRSRAANGSRTPVGDRTLVAGESLALYAVGRDQHGNATGPVVSPDRERKPGDPRPDSFLDRARSDDGRSGDVTAAHASLPAASTARFRPPTAPVRCDRAHAGTRRMRSATRRSSSVTRSTSSPWPATPSGT
jgi:hypothetical protein